MYILTYSIWVLCGLCVVLGNLITSQFPKFPNSEGPRDQDVPAEPLSHLNQGSNNASTASYSDDAYYLLDLMDLWDLLDIPCYTYQLM